LRTRSVRGRPLAGTSIQPALPPSKWHCLRTPGRSRAQREDDHGQIARPPDPELPLHRNILRLEKLHQALMSPFPAESGLFDAAERGGGIRDEASVESDHSEIQFLAEAQRASQVARVNIGYQTVLGRVSASNHFLLRPEALDWCYRT